MYLIVFNIEQHYYRIFNAVYMIYEKKEGTKKMISVIKRDGHRATYDRNKIVSAIQKANTEVDQEERISEEQIYNILASIENRGFDEMAVEVFRILLNRSLWPRRNLFLQKHTSFIVIQENLLEKPILLMILFLH